jgi:hypothetical protein
MSEIEERRDLLQRRILDTDRLLRELILERDEVERRILAETLESMKKTGERA